jgi:ArsR family transcriptional regulator
MLRLARAKLLVGSDEKTQAILSGKIELKLGDFNHLPIKDGKVDSVILHQVLHYAQHPEAVLTEVSRVLGRNGVLLIADFASHDREELRRDHAHARLGFSGDSMERWFSAAQLDLVQCRTLDGGELSVKIWVGRKSGLTKLHPDSGKNLFQSSNEKRASA